MDDAALTRLAGIERERIKVIGDNILKTRPWLGFRAYEAAAKEIGCKFDLIDTSHMMGPDFALGLYNGDAS